MRLGERLVIDAATASQTYRGRTAPRCRRTRQPTTLDREARARRLSADSVGSVLAAASHRPAGFRAPAGLTEREAEVVGLLACSLQTKQIARGLGISIKTVDRHIRTPTERSASRPEQQPKCSPCSMRWRPGENTRWLQRAAVPNVAVEPAR
jgi:DNA-binding CsgD family transcriptional regulator